MIRNKTARTALCILLAITLLASFSLALGISPARQTIDFEAKAHHKISFDIVNDQHKDLRLLLNVEGDAKDTIVILKEQIVYVSEEEDAKRIEFDVYLPEKFDEPGVKEVRIIAVEMPKAEQAAMMVGAVAGVAFQLRIKVPYEGKYLSLDELEIHSGNAGSNIEFILPINNLGTENITDITATIEIMSATNEKIAELRQEAISLDARKRYTAKMNWLANVNPGKYYAIATVKYEDKALKKEKVFVIGGITVEILGMKTQNFELGGIADLEIKVKSKWNEKLTNVYGEMLITDAKGENEIRLATPSIDLLPGKESSLHAYWNTKGLSEGIYYATFRLHLADTFIEKKFELILTLNEIEANMLSATARAILGKPKESALTALIVILIIINIYWFIYVRRKK